MSVGSAGPDLGKLSFAIAQRVKAILSPLEDVCRYREQRSEDFAAYDVKPGRPGALSFSIAIAPGGVNLDTPHFSIREFPVTEARVVEDMIEAIVEGRVRRVTRLSAGGKLLAAKIYLFDAGGRTLFKHRRQAGALAGLTRTARRGRERFPAYRAAA
jgi:hypothetical protein